MGARIVEGGECQVDVVGAIRAGPPDQQAVGRARQAVSANHLGADALDGHVDELHLGECGEVLEVERVSRVGSAEVEAVIGAPRQHRLRHHLAVDEVIGGEEGEHPILEAEAVERDVVLVRETPGLTISGYARWNSSDSPPAALTSVV